jgi:hypothetical protein
MAGANPKWEYRRMSDPQPAEVTETAPEQPAPPKPAPPAQSAKVAEKVPAEPKQQEPQPDPTDQLPADHPLVKAFAAQKALIKDLKPKATQFDALVESQKTELQKALDRAEAAEGVAYALQSAQTIRDAKDDVSKRTGVPADVLRGSDLEELEAHAASLKALLPEPRKPGQVPGEGRTVTTGTGDPATQFAELIRNARRG